MALRGETVGVAFVRILADGSGLDQSIKDEMRAREGAFEQAGRQDSDAWQKGFDDEFARRGNFVKIQTSLAKAAGKFDAIGRIAGDDFGDGFLDRLDVQFRKRFGPEIGDRLSNELRDAIVNKQSAAQIKEFVDDIGQHVIRVTRQIQVEEQQQATDAERAWRTSFQQIERDTDRISRSIQREAANMGTAFQRTGDAIENAFSRSARQFEIDVDRITKDNDRLRRSMTQSTGDISDLSFVIGRTFGKGSRNNFLNFVGTMVGGLSNIIEKLPGMKFLLGGVSDKLAEASRNGESFFKLIFEGGAVGGLATMARGLAGFGIAVSALFVLLGPLVSLFAGLAGGIIAMAGSITFAIAAGLPVLIGLLGGLGGAVAIGIAAFSGLSDEMKKTLKEDVEPLTKRFKEMADTIAKPVFAALRDIIPIIDRAVEAFEPFAKPFGRGFADSLRNFASILQTPAFDKFAQVFGEFLPGAMRDLSQVIANLGRALLGIFRASIPITKEFLDWLVDITDEFADWTNSVKGQKALKQFFKEAGESARVVGDLIKDIVKAIGLLLRAGRPSGDELLGDIDDKVEEFVQFLQDPKNQDVIENWFGDAKEITRNFGDVINSLANILGILDNPGFRDAANIFLDIFEAIADLAGAALDASDGFLLLSPPIGAVVAAVKGLIDLFEGFSFGKFFGDFFGDFRRGFSPSNFAGMINGPAIVKGILGKIGDIDISKIIDVAKVLGKILGSLPSPGEIISKMAFDLTKIILSLGKMVGDILGSLPSPGQIIEKMAFDIFKIVEGGASLVGRIKELLPSAAELVEEIGTLTLSMIVNIDWPDPPGGLSWDDIGSRLNDIVPRTAGGGIFSGAQTRLIGEAGPEAVVPLDRPLSQVDPAVRMLSAIAQGKWPGHSTSNSRSIDVGGIQIVTPTEDPAAVATELLNQLAATAYV